MLYKATFAILLYLLISLNISYGQTFEGNPVNNYIHFANESTHGMLIAHRILEGFNQEVNAFVDLQSNQFNFYSNKDLPKDLFNDPEQWFYNISPNKLYIKAKSTPWTSPSKVELDRVIDEMHQICINVNQMRFKMEDFINNNDLTQTDKQIEIFKQLNHCASLYDRYFEVNDQLHAQVNLYLDQEQNASLQKNNFRTIQRTIKSLLEIIRYGFYDELPSKLQTLKTQNEILQSQTVRDNRLKDAQLAVAEALVMVEAFRAKKAIPERYDIYGSAYYYYNVQLISTLNRYGKGFVSNANKLLAAQDAQQVLLLEEPHYFKVVLPKKEIHFEKSEKVIKTLPTKLKERTVIVSKTAIQHTEKKILLEIFDHRQEDGDIISLNFNGHWILKERKLSKLPLKLIVELNETGENYLLLHAENLGDIPPNTIAVRYYIEGQRKLVVLNSDMDHSEVIRFDKIEAEE